MTYYVRERNGEYWVSDSFADETSVYYVKPVDFEGRQHYQIMRDWWLTENPDAPLETEGCERHLTEASAHLRLKNLLAGLSMGNDREKREIHGTDEYPGQDLSMQSATWDWNEFGDV